MSTGRLTKIDIEARIYKLKNSLYNGEYQDKNGDWHKGYHYALDKVLDIINEYRL